MQDEGNNGFVHALPPLQHAFGQIGHRAAVAELQKETQKKENKNCNSALMGKSAPSFGWGLSGRF